MLTSHGRRCKVFRKISETPLKNVIALPVTSLPKKADNVLNTEACDGQACLVVS